MQQVITIKRTTAGDPDFKLLVVCLDGELWNELGEDQSTYDQYNKVPDIQTAIVIYKDDEPVACGCFKPFDEYTVEVKRMFVQKQHRGKGNSKKLLAALENWALELGYHAAVLETSLHFTTARNLYTSAGYKTIKNYGPYVGLPESVCMKKAFVIATSV